MGARPGRGARGERKDGEKGWGGGDDRDVGAGEGVCEGGEVEGWRGRHVGGLGAAGEVERAGREWEGVEGWRVGGGEGAGKATGRLNADRWRRTSGQVIMKPFSAVGMDTSHTEAVYREP